MMMSSFILLFLCVLLTIVTSSFVLSIPCPNAVSPTTVRIFGDRFSNDSYCANEFATGLGTVRSVIIGPLSHIIIVSAGQIRLLRDLDNDGRISGTNENVLLVSVSGLNHGLLLSNGYLYASSTTAVYRWSYTAPSSFDQLPTLGTQESVITNIPNGGHATRSIAQYDFKSLFINVNTSLIPSSPLNYPTTVDGNRDTVDPYLYVQVGSGSNLDADSSRANIRRFDLRNYSPSAPFTFTSGSIAFDGLRNEVGINFDAYGLLWGVENGIDNANRAPFGDVHIDNPGEEVNWFTKERLGKSYGYPYCFSEYNIAASKGGLGRGTQWATNPSSTTYNDQWCRNTDNVITPIYQLPAHVAPLSISFYYGSAFPFLNNRPLIGLHGSWNRDPPAGYRVVSLMMNNKGEPIDHEEIFAYRGETGKSETGSGYTYRPVSVITDYSNGDIYISSDADGKLIRIRSTNNNNNTYNQTGELPSPSSANEINRGWGSIIMIGVISLLMIIYQH